MGYDVDRLLEKAGDGFDDNRVISVESELKKIQNDEFANTQVKDAIAMDKAAKSEQKPAETAVHNETENAKWQRRLFPPDTRNAGRKTSVDNSTCDIKGFPKSLLRMAKSSFPEAANMKALAAFVYAHRDTELDIDYSDIPDDIVQLASTIDKYKTMMQMDRNIRYINDMLKRLNLMGDDMILALSYLIYDRLGFRTDNPTRPDDINFEPVGLRELTKHLEDSADRIRKEEQYQEGRPL